MNMISRPSYNVEHCENIIPYSESSLSGVANEKSTSYSEWLCFVPFSNAAICVSV